MCSLLLVWERRGGSQEEGVVVNEEKAKSVLQVIIGALSGYLLGA